MEDFKTLLRAQGFRATPGRVALMHALYASKKPLTVDELSRRLDLNVVTLYRALNELAQRGLLLRGSGMGDAMHFSYPKNHHHHMVCADCGFTSKCGVC
jgi:Fe2+ or Zn2+ uptake regulation protein